MIPLDNPYFPNASDLKRYLADCIDTTWVGWQGKYNNQLREKLCEKLNRKFSIAVSSGTYAMYLAVASLGLNKGTEIIVPTECYYGNVYAIVANGMIPKFVDCTENSPNTTAEKIIEAITENTKATLIPHMYGKVIDLTQLKEHKHRIFVIEDTALTLSPSANNVGDIVCTSFHNKIITSGEGGAVLVNDSELYKNLMRLWNPGTNNASGVVFLSGKLSNVASAIALSQLEVLDELIEKRNQVYKRYNSNLGLDQKYDVCWRYQYQCSDPKNTTDILRINDIDSRQVFKPMHYFYSNKQFPNAEKYWSSHIDLPAGPLLSEENVDKVCDVISKISKN